MKYVRTVLLGSALFLPIVPVLQAQDNTRPPIEHSGLWLSGGLGGGSTDNDEGSLTSGDDSGPAGYFRLGGSVSQHILLGGEVIGMTFDRDGTDVSFANATFTLIYDPALPGGRDSGSLSGRATIAASAETST